MSLSTTISKNVYVGDGSEVDFDYEFKIFQDSDLVVKEILIADPFTETILTLTTDYTVSGAGSATGGVVTLGTATPATKNLVIMRILTIIQPLILEQNGDNPSKSMEDQYDKSIMISQQLQEQLDRAVLTGADDSGETTSIDLASPGPIGGTTPAAGTFTVLTCSSMTLGGKLTAGANEIEGSAFDINGGAADNLVIGAGTATTGKFTVLTTTSAAIMAAVGITGTLTVNDLTNGVCQLVDNDGTNHGIHIKQDAVLASAKNALLVISDVTQVNSSLVLFEQDGASSDKPVLTISNASAGASTLINQTGALGASMPAFKITTSANPAGSDAHAFHISNTAERTATNSELLYVVESNASTTKSVASIVNAGTGGTLVLTKTNAGGGVILTIVDAGTGIQIQGIGNENLTNSGVWTDRTSLFADKENIVDLDTSSLTDKLKGMKLYRYQKKDEVYGNKIEKNGKKVKEYPKDKKRPDAKEYVGLILDEPTTPEELISRDLEGNINGKSRTHIAEFLLGVCQEIIKRVEVLETA